MTWDDIFFCRICKNKPTLDDWSIGKMEFSVNLQSKMFVGKSRNNNKLFVIDLA